MAHVWGSQTGIPVKDPADQTSPMGLAFEWVGRILASVATWRRGALQARRLREGEVGKHEEGADQRVGGTLE